MQTNPFFRKLWWILPVTMLCGPLRAEEPPLKELLRDGLYAEEVTRDPEAAAKHYEQVLTRYAEQRDFAASALFRLAEVRRKQDRKEDAVKLYQQLLAEFPGAVNETKLANENLAALGGKPVEAKTAESDYEGEELARLERSAKSAPDILLDPSELKLASERGYAKVVEFLLKAGSRPYGGDALAVAAERGNLEIVKMLTAGDSLPPADLAAKAIAQAIGYERYTVLEYLLEKGLKPGRVIESGVNLPAISYALFYGKRQCAEILLKHGADLNAMVDAGEPTGPTSAGTPLALMIERGNFDDAEWLLKNGAKPDIPDPYYGATPLHYTALSKKDGCLGLMEKLLSAGADMNRISSLKKMSWQDRGLVGASPLVTAVESGFQVSEKVRLLVKHGARASGQEERLSEAITNSYEGKIEELPQVIELLAGGGASVREMKLMAWAVSSRNLPFITSLLKHGCDPNVNYEGGITLLAKACLDGNTELAKMLLDSGADPGSTTAQGLNLIQLTATKCYQKGAVECLKLLADAGLEPDLRWAESRYEGVLREPLRFLLDRFVIPELAGGERVSFVMDLSGGLETVPMAEGRASGKPPLLERWLLDRDPQLNFTRINGVPSKYQWWIWRKDAQGVLAATEFDISGGKPLPELQWGDVVECRLVSTETGTYTFSSGLTPELRWLLRKRISFPITVETEGGSREMTMRGDRVVFDPTKNELPLCGVQEAVEMLWQTAGYPSIGQGMTGQASLVIQDPSFIVISRKDWPEVRLKFGSSEAGKFQLESGDQVKTEFSEQYLSRMKDYRKYVVTVKAEGYPFIRRYGIGEDYMKGMVVPTLIQVLVDLQVPRRTDWSLWEGKTTLGPAELSDGAGIFEGFALMPRPDLSHIRIRRVENEREKIIDVDLTKAVSVMTEATTPEEARKADFALQGGDIVEISLKPETAGESWKGFSPEETRFFSRALSGNVQMVDGTGNVTFSAIDWRPVNFIETEAGWLPVPAKEGVPSPRAWWFTRGKIGSVTRGSITESSNASFVFLRDGDEFRANPEGAQGGQLPASRPPRQRVAPSGTQPALPSRIR